MKVNVIFLCRDIKIISNTFMDISMCFPFALPFHEVSILRGVLRAKVWEKHLISWMLLIYIQVSVNIHVAFSAPFSASYHPPI